MDRAIQAELAELRRRAFGLHPDIEADLAATARLVELEQLVLAEHAASVAGLRGERSTMEGSPSSRGAPHVGPMWPTEPGASTTDAEPSADAVPPHRAVRARRRDGLVLAINASRIFSLFACVIAGLPKTDRSSLLSRNSLPTSPSSFLTVSVSPCFSSTSASAVE